MILKFTAKDSDRTFYVASQTIAGIDRLFINPKPRVVTAEPSPLPMEEVGSALLLLGGVQMMVEEMADDIAKQLGFTAA